VFLVTLMSLRVFSQEDIPLQDTTLIRDLFMSSDTTSMILKISADAVDEKVIYSSDPDGYIKNDLVNRRATIVKGGVVNY